VLTSPGQIQDPSMAKLFPQTDELGPVFIRTFATNGSATFQFYDDAPIYGPNGYVDVQLRAFGSTVDYNSGWVIFFLRGVDFSDKKQLRFFIRGASGAEQIGLKAKDVLGREVAILLSKGSY